MSLTRQYAKDAQRLAKLHQELLNAGITPERVEGSDLTIWLTLADGTNVATVDALVAAHDPLTPGPAEAQATADTASMADLAQTYSNMKAGLDTIRTHMASINNGPASPTATQTGTALKTLAGDVTTLCNGLDKLLDVVRGLVRREVVGG